MANPQKENGYTPIANEILDQLIQLPLNGTQWRIVGTVWRYTYGFSRKDHKFSETFISKTTNIHKKQIQRELNKLIEFKIITIIQEATFNTSRILNFNKNYELWEVSKTLPVSKLDVTTKTIPVVEIDTHTGSGLDTTGGSELATQDKQKAIIKTNIYTDAFEKFYKQYPRPDAKQRSFENWKKCLKKYKVEDLMKACNNYELKTKQDRTEKQFIKTSANFLSTKDNYYVDYIDYEVEEKQDQYRLER